MTTVDILVFAPLIPAMPVIILWYLPWERWIPKHLPNSVVGPYLLYCAFAAWYFEMPWWLVGGVILFGSVVCAMAIFKTKRQQ